MVSEAVGTSNTVVKGFSSKPSSITAPERRVHSYLNITSIVNASRLSRVIIEFSVDRAWTERLGFGYGEGWILDNDQLALHDDHIHLGYNQNRGTRNSR